MVHSPTPGAGIESVGSGASLGEGWGRGCSPAVIQGCISSVATTAHSMTSPSGAHPSMETKPQECGWVCRRCAPRSGLRHGRDPPGPAKCSAPSKELQQSTVFGRRCLGALKNLMESCSKPLGSGFCRSLKAAGLLGGETEALLIHTSGRDEPQLLGNNNVAVGSCPFSAAAATRGAHPTAQGGKYFPPPPPPPTSHGFPMSSGQAAARKHIKGCRGLVAVPAGSSCGLKATALPQQEKVESQGDTSSRGGLCVGDGAPVPAVPPPAPPNPPSAVPLQGQYGALVQRP